MESRTDPLSDLIRLEVKLVDLIRRHYRAIIEVESTGEGPPGHFGHFNYKLPSFLLAHLFQLDHPDNPYKGDAQIADMSIGLVDRWVSDWHQVRDQGERTSTSEWPIYAATESMLMLGDAVDGRRREEWSDFVANYCRFGVERPFGFTAPNHEAWRMLAMYSAGKAFEHPEWCDAALFFTKRFIEYQTAEGFWEEGRHHGPSMRYNNVCLAGLALLYRHSGEDFIRPAVERLATFMTTYTFPDATTVGAFDGRQSTSLAYYAPVVPGFELVPAGRTLNARGIELWRRTGRMDEVSRFSNSLWYGFFSTIFYSAACRYYAQMLPAEAGKNAIREDEGLPVDREGTLEHHSAAFDGLIHRDQPWVVALSSQNSDVPKDTDSLMRLDRQSRIELWHQKAGLVLGGGHNRNDASIPYANVVMDTGLDGEMTFGILDQQHRAIHRRYFLPRLAGSRIKAGAPHLRIVFAHGAVDFQIRFQDASTCLLHASWDVCEVRRLGLQLPVIVWDGADLDLDGVLQSPEGAEESGRPLTAILKTSGGPFSSSTTLEIPEGVPCRVHYPLEILRTYKGNLAEEDELKAPFRMALVSCQWTDPKSKGEATFKVSVEDAPSS